MAKVGISISIGKSRRALPDNLWGDRPRSVSRDGNFLDELGSITHGSFSFRGYNLWPIFLVFKTFIFSV